MSTYDAVNGVGKFAGKPDPNLRALFALYTETFTLVTRQDTGIRTFGQLQKRKVDIGNPGSGERNTMELLMQAQGWTQDTFAKVKVPDSNKEEVSQLPAAKRAAALCKKEIDAYVYMVGHPSNAMREVARNCSVVFIPIPDDVVSNFVKKYPFYTPTEIPSGIISRYRYAGTEHWCISNGRCLPRTFLKKPLIKSPKMFSLNLKHSNV